MPHAQCCSYIDYNVIDVIINALLAQVTVWMNTIMGSQKEN